MNSLEGLNLHSENITDLEWAAMAREGNPEAVATLVRRHAPRVRAILYPMVLNHADADDLAQETMAKVAASLATFRGGAAFSTWVHRIAVNTALNFIKRQKRRAVEILDDAALARAEDFSAPKPPEQLEAGETDAAISRAMSRLSPEQRLAISLVVLQDMDEREAASVAGCLPATLRWRFHAARKKLKHVLRNLK